MKKVILIGGAGSGIGCIHTINKVNGKEVGIKTIDDGDATNINGIFPQYNTTTYTITRLPELPQVFIPKNKGHKRPYKFHK